MPEIELAYNRTSITIPIPDSKTVHTLLPKPIKAIDDPQSSYLHKLETPLGGLPLGNLAGKNKREVLIIVPDHTRVSGIERSLPWLLDALNGFGVADEKITILVALGSHSKPSDMILRQTIGNVIERVKIELHDTDGPVTDYGITGMGTPVRINAKLAEAGLIILCTNCVHHYFAGYGGGRKLILPGVSTLETIARNHSLTFHESGKHGGGRHPGVRSGSLNGNPVHEDMLEAVHMVLDGKAHFTIISVLTPDREFGYFFTGDFDRAHKLACKVVDDHNMVDLPHGEADLVLASAGGYPRDMNVVQAHKAMDNAAHALKPGGTLLLMMACSDGYGNTAIEEFAQWDLDTIKAKLRENYAVNGQTVYAIKEKTGKFRIVAMSELPVEFLKKVGLIPAENLNRAIELIGDSVGKAEIIYHIPRADLTVPKL